MPEQTTEEVQDMVLRLLSSDIVVQADANEMVDGLFGQVFLWVFECLPYLYERSIFPAWNIGAAYYASSVIPGVLDLAYTPPKSPTRIVKLVKLRALRRQLLGNDFVQLSKMWHSYFSVPARIERQAAEIGPLEDAIGIHYRGNDKQLALWDTNPVSYADYGSIIEQFIKERPRYRRIFLATDDKGFLPYLKTRISLPIVNLGASGFHKTVVSDEEKTTKSDMALLDCILLSRCGVVLLTSSALPSFAKIFKPDLEIYRVAASKFFTNTPYFPVAHIPIYRASNRKVAEIVDRLLEGDWTSTPEARKFTDPFASRPYWPYFLRLIYTAFHQLPGMTWLRQAPNWLASINRRWIARSK